MTITRWFEKDCGFCDNCRHPRERFEAKEEVLLALKAVVQTDERFGLDHIGTVLMGMSNPHVISYAHNQLPIYGQGKGHDAQFWHSVLRQCLRKRREHRRHIAILTAHQTGIFRQVERREQLPGVA